MPLGPLYLGKSSDDLNDLADNLEATAKALRALARRQVMQSDLVDARKRRGALLDLPDLVAARLEGGVTLERAIEMVGWETGERREVIRYHLAYREKAEKEQRRAARDREIMRLAGRGWSNAEIGRRIGLHPSTVSRILQRQVKRWPAAAE